MAGSGRGWGGVRHELARSTGPIRSGDSVRRAVALVAAAQGPKCENLLLCRKIIPSYHIPPARLALPRNCVLRELVSGKLVLNEVGNQPLGLTPSDAAASVPGEAHDSGVCLFQPFWGWAEGFPREILNETWQGCPPRTLTTDQGVIC